MSLKSRYRTRSDGPVKLKKTSTANTEIQMAVIMGVPGRRLRALSLCLAHLVKRAAREYEEHSQPRDHSARTPLPCKWTKGYIRRGTLVR